MSLPNYLAKIKSSGIYRFVWDKSEITATDAETLRLMVGYSEKGPFNTPVYVDNTADFIRIFGGINKKLERNGVFFHRMCLQALSAGPILALNLKKFDTKRDANDTLTTTEQVGYVVANGAGALVNTATGGNSLTANVTDVYDISRFWKLEPNKLNNLSDGSQYITIAATDSESSSASIFMRGCRPNGYDVTIKTWYTTIGEDMPDYFEGYENMLVSDFFAEIYVFRGQFTPGIAQSVELKDYFDVDASGNVTLKKGIKDAFGQDIDTLDALAMNENSGFVQKYQGVLIPFFKNSSTATYLSLDLIFNSDYETHKLLMTFNSDSLGETLTPDDISTSGVTNLSRQDVYDIVNNVRVNGKTATDTLAILSNSDLVTRCLTYSSAGNFVGGDTNEAKLEEGGDINFIAVETSTGISKASSVLQFTAAAYNKLKPAKGNRLIVAVKENDDDTSNTAKLKSVFVESVSDTDHTVTVNVNTAFGIQPSNAATTTSTASSTIGDNPTPVETFGIMVDKNGVVYDNSWADYLVDDADDNAPFTDGYTITIKDGKTPEDCGLVSPELPNGGIAFAEEDAPTEAASTSSNYVLKIVNPITGVHTMSPLYLKGYTYSKPKPTSQTVTGIGTLEPRGVLAKREWQKDILSCLSMTESGYPGLIEALTNRLDIDYRYIVDTFESYPDYELKSVLALIAKKKDNCLALLNFPSVQSFVDCGRIQTTGDSGVKAYNDGRPFTDSNGAFNINYVKQGCRPMSSAGVTFSLPSIDNGASWCSFNTPVVLSDGTVKTTCPAAALVSNKFMEKYNSRQPYYIVAGPVYGRLTYPGLVGPDHNYTRAELDVLEPMGVNATVYVPRKGTYINSNQTAKQTPVTALSKINVRELVIYLQDQIEDMLENYHWEFNTQALRNIIKAKADTICENVRANGGIHKFVNVCDETNNTDDVINNEMIVLSTSIEPGMGAGKMVQELTIYKRGGMDAVIS